MIGSIIGKIGGVYSRLLMKRVNDKNELHRLRGLFEIKLAGGGKCVPYLWSVNRFMWNDEEADKQFLKYQKTLHRLYKSPQLEIEIFE